MSKKLLIIILIGITIPFFVKAGFFMNLWNDFWGVNQQVESPQLGSTVLFPYGGGTGASTTPVSGQIFIGNDDGTYTVADITEGTNITIATLFRELFLIFFIFFNFHYY